MDIRENSKQEATQFGDQKLRTRQQDAWGDDSNCLGAIAMHGRKGFWDKNAGRYDRFIRNDRAAYEKMYGLTRPVVKANGAH